jgi:hypothetical protein
MYPFNPRIYPRTLASILELRVANCEILLHREDMQIETESRWSMENITAKYNRARDLVLAGGYDALLTVEADMILPRNAVQRLLTVEADVAYGLYVSRRHKHYWLAFSELGPENKGRSLSEDPERARESWGQVVETAGVGMGCTLIHRRVLERIPFRRVIDGMSNDWYFALDCQAAGFRQAHDLGVICGHIDGEAVYWPEPFVDKLYRIDFS